MYKPSIYLCLIIPIFVSQGFLGCEKVADSLNETLNADPQRSTCQAYCEWAIACHAQARNIDPEATLADCLSRTHTVNEECEIMETEGINKLSAGLYESCTDAIDAERVGNRCGPFTGDAVEVNTSTPPVDCASVASDDIDVFNTARIATAETNDALCERVSVTLCQRSTSCLIDEYNLPESFLEELMPSLEDQCTAQFEEDVTSTCREDALYDISSEESDAPEMEADADTSELEDATPSVFLSVNVSREAALSCLLSLAELACDDIFGADLPPACAGAFSDPANTANVLNTFACGLDRPELEPICGG